jgi:hypothetical protein
MTGHRPRRPARAAAPPAGPPVLVAAVSAAAEAGPAIAAGADMIDATGLSEQAVASIRARDPGARLWAGSPAAADADGRGVRGGPATPAAAVARAAVLTWLGAPAIRTRHVRPVRRAIDMTSSIAGTRLPSRTTRGLG